MVESPGRVVVLDLRTPQTARPFAMEGPAYAIWQALAEQSTTEKVVERVAAHFGIPAAEVEPDVRAFLAELESRGLAFTSLRGTGGTGGTGLDPASPCS